MLRKTIIALCSLAMLAATFAASGGPQAQAQEGPQLRVLAELQVPGSREVKYPSVVAGGDLVHVTGNANRDEALAWTKAAAATSFPNPVELGPAEGQPDFSTTSVAKGPDGTIYAAWVNQPSRTIFLRQRNSNGVWGPTRTVDRGASFPVSPQVAVSSNGQIFVAYRIPDRPIRYRFSSDGGVSWSNVRNVDNDIVAYNSPIGLAGGPNGSMAVTFTAGAGNRLQIFVGLWNGSDFNVQRVTTFAGDYADSSVSIGPDGKVYAAWRGVAESGGNSGVFYAERASDGSWPRSRLTGGKITGTVSVNADEGGNVHFTWLAAPSGDNQVYYAFKPANAAPVGPVGSGRRGALFNSRGYGSLGNNAAYNHSVTEEFSGSGLRTLYALFQPDIAVFGGQPVVENDAPRAARSVDNTVLVSFRNVVGTPTHVRYAWNREPAAGDPWVPYAATLRVRVPEEIYNSLTCENAILYTQLARLNSAGQPVELENRPSSDTVQIDGLVEASVVVNNPSAFGPRAAGDTGAPGGDPRYTRARQVHLTVINVTDCNGLSSLGVGATPNAADASYDLDANGNFAGVVPLPNQTALVAGQQTTFYVRVADGAGNVRIFPFTVILDEDKPVLNEQNPGTLEVAASPKGDILQDLTFTNLNIRDETYRDPSDPDPNRRFWGFWIANSPDEVENPLSDPNLKWSVVDAPPSVADGEDYKVVLRDWSLATGLTRAQQEAGDFFIYVRFLDGAGNPTDGYLSVRVEASQMEYLDTLLPWLRK